MSEPANLDLIWGAAAVGAYLGLTEGQAKYALEKGSIPGRKIALGGRGRWVASREALRKFFVDRERAA